MEVKEVNMSELPEDTVDGVKMYGTTSYETQVAILSHYLHNFDGRHDIFHKGTPEFGIIEIFRHFLSFYRVC